MSEFDDRPLYKIDDEETDDAPLYSLNDVPLEPSSGRDDEDYDDEEEDADSIYDEEIDADEPLAYAGERKEPVKKSEPSPFGIMLRTMLTPVEGWKALKRARFSTDRFASGCFYPLVALAAISEGSTLFYEANRSLSDWAVEGLITFITFFFGYFAVLLLGGAVLPSGVRDVLKKDIGKQLVMLAMSTIALFYSLLCLLPMLDPVLVFLPIWTIYLVFKGVRILRIPKEKEQITVSVLCVLIVGVPIICNWVVAELLKFSMPG